MSFPASSRWVSRRCPVVLQKCSKSLMAPGSVAMTRSTPPSGTSRMALRAFSTGSGHLSPLVSRMTGDALIGSAEAVVLGKAVGGDTAARAARADPGAQIALGPRAIAALPGEPVGAVEHLGIGERAVVVALQDDAAPARHLRHLAHG